MAIHWYLNEMLKLLVHEVQLYIDPGYLRSILSRHLGELQAVMDFNQVM